MGGDGEMPASQDPHPFAALQGHQYLSLTTYRKAGTPVPTPVWFAQEGDRLYVFTLAGAGKVKRIRHTPRVTVAPCTVSGKVVGPQAEAIARILPPQEITVAWRALRRKYGWKMAIGDLFSRLMRRRRAYLVITPAGARHA